MRAEEMTFQSPLPRIPEPPHTFLPPPYTPAHFPTPTLHTRSPLLQVNPVKRITIQGIKEHKWFMEDLPAYLFPLPGDKDSAQINSVVLAEVCQKLSVSPGEVGVAIDYPSMNNQFIAVQQVYAGPVHFCAGPGSEATCTGISQRCKHMQLTQAHTVMLNHFPSLNV